MVMMSVMLLILLLVLFAVGITGTDTSAAVGVSVVIIGDATAIVGVAVIGVTATATVMATVTVNAEIHGHSLDSESVPLVWIATTATRRTCNERLRIDAPERPYDTSFGSLQQRRDGHDRHYRRLFMHEPFDDTQSQ